jgi:peptidoglycan-associated lipoprotein
MTGRSITMLTLLLSMVAGCAKQPATTGASAPTPTTGRSATVTPAPAVPREGSAGGGVARPATATAKKPDGARPEPKDFAAVSDLPDIYFDFDRYDLRPSAQRILLAHATWLRSGTKTLVIIEGHCDERGTNEYNVALGERRAKAAMNYLVSRGVDARRISLISYGELRPQCRSHDEACWAKNRRAHFLVKAQ